VGPGFRRDDGKLSGEPGMTFALPAALRKMNRECAAGCFALRQSLPFSLAFRVSRRSLPLARALCMPGGCLLLGGRMSGSRRRRTETACPRHRRDQRFMSSGGGASRSRGARRARYRRARGERIRVSAARHAPSQHGRGMGALCDLAFVELPLWPRPRRRDRLFRKSTIGVEGGGYF